MRTYGTAKLHDGRWFLFVEPHVAIRLKRMFERADKARTDAIVIADTPEVCRELEWFAERYPLVFERFGHTNKVTPWDEPAGTVTTGTHPSNGAVAVADPRLVDGRTRFKHCDRVTPWTEPAGTVTTSPAPSSGAIAVADPRVALGCEPRNGTYGVVDWQRPAPTVTGSVSIDCGTGAVADPRPAGAPPLPASYRFLTVDEAAARLDDKPPRDVPVIASPHDGTWHRPLTTLELAVLQGLPWKVDGKPLALAGRGIAKWRERIGNAVPVGAGAAIAESLLTALLAGALGNWMLGSLGGTDVWVRRDDGATEDEALVEVVDAA